MVVSDDLQVIQCSFSVITYTVPKIIINMKGAVKMRAESKKTKKMQKYSGNALFKAFFLR